MRPKRPCPPEKIIAERYLTSYLVVIDQKLSCDIAMVFVQKN